MVLKTEIPIYHYSYARNPKLNLQQQQLIHLRWVTKILLKQEMDNHT